MTRGLASQIKPDQVYRRRVTSRGGASPPHAPHARSAAGRWPLPNVTALWHPCLPSPSRDPRPPAHAEIPSVGPQARSLGVFATARPGPECSRKGRGLRQRPNEIDSASTAMARSEPGSRWNPSVSRRTSTPAATTAQKRFIGRVSVFRAPREANGPRLWQHLQGDSFNGLACRDRDQRRHREAHMSVLASPDTSPRGTRNCRPLRIRQRCRQDLGHTQPHDVRPPRGTKGDTQGGRSQPHPLGGRAGREGDAARSVRCNQHAPVQPRPCPGVDPGRQGVC